MAEVPTTVWTFGFGSNMSVENVEQKKGYKVYDHLVGIVKGYKMAFNISAMQKVEPAFANAVKGTDNDVIHGVAIQISKNDMEDLIKQESGYDKLKVTVNGYNGRTIADCIMFSNSKANLPPEKQTPSARYLKLVIKGAIEGNLDEAYINQLKATNTYVPDQETLVRRKALSLPSSLPCFTVDELLATKALSLESGADAYVGVLGYIIRMPRSKCFFSSHMGRDVTARNLRHYRGISADANDDMGKPPYPKLQLLSSDEVEYVYNWLDFYLDKGEVVGYLKEFLEENDMTMV